MPATQAKLEWSRRRIRGGEGARHHKQWISACGRYVIEWRNRRFGVKMPPLYRVLLRSERGGREQLDHLEPRRGLITHRTFDSAARRCQQHARAALTTEPQRSQRSE